jgi:hypothetical protein
VLTPFKPAFYRKEGLRPKFFVSGRIFRLIWQKTSARSWQHCSRPGSRDPTLEEGGRVVLRLRLQFCEIFKKSGLGIVLEFSDSLESLKLIRNKL